MFKKTEVELELRTGTDMLLIAERMNIAKCQKLVCNMFDKKNYAVHIKVLKLALDYRLTLEKIHRVIEINQETWLKASIDMKRELRKKT